MRKGTLLLHFSHGLQFKSLFAQVFSKFGKGGSVRSKEIQGSRKTLSIAKERASNRIGCWLFCGEGAKGGLSALRMCILRTPEWCNPANQFLGGDIAFLPPIGSCF